MFKKKEEKESIEISNKMLWHPKLTVKNVGRYHGEKRNQ